MAKKRNIAQEIKEGMLETLAFVRGEETEGRISYFYNGEEICPRKIREDKLNVSREVFYDYFNLSVNSQRNWELGLRTPPEHTLAYYKLIGTNPAIIYKMLHGKKMPGTTSLN